MNMDEIRMMKTKLEESIREEVASFNRQTGMRVTDMDLIRHELQDATGRTASTVYEVIVRAEV